MGQQDLTQKSLEHYPDVFADIINALLYEGRQLLLPQCLQPAPTESLYHSRTGKLRNQFQDISKYEMREGKILLQYVVENETNPDKRLLLRKAGYEGAIYREQFDRKDNEIYPVISIVLYWGKGRRRIERNMQSLFVGTPFPREAVRYIGNAELYFFQMRTLPARVRERFRSDMRIVVDYLAEGKAYQPTGQPIIHLREFLLLMEALTGDSRYEQFLPQPEQQEREGGITMCELLDKYEKRGIEKGIEKGISALVVTCRSLQCTKEEAVRRLRSLYEFKSDEEAGEKVDMYWELK